MEEMIERLRWEALESSGHNRRAREMFLEAADALSADDAAATPAMDEMTKAPACHFCGDEVQRNSDRWGHFYYCGCGARGPYGATPAIAFKRWSDALAAPPPSTQKVRPELPLQYEDGPDYCTVRDALGRDFALTMQPDLMKAMEAALSTNPGEQ